MSNFITVEIGGKLTAFNLANILKIEINNDDSATLHLIDGSTQALTRAEYQFIIFTYSNLMSGIFKSSIYETAKERFNENRGTDVRL